MVWNSGQFPHLVDVHGQPAQRRFQVLHDLLDRSGKDGRHFEIRVVPDAEFGFVHGKGGVIEGPSGQRLHLSAAPTTAPAPGRKTTSWSGRTTTPKASPGCRKSSTRSGRRAFPCPSSSSSRSDGWAQRTVIEQSAPWKENPKPEPLLAEVPTATELFGFWDHQKYFINLGFSEHLKYKDDPNRGARFLLGDGVGLGKTLQLGAIAKLIGTLDALPILIMVPKPLTTQWQEECG